MKKNIKIDRLALIKQSAERIAAKRAEEASFQESIRRLDERKAAIKAHQKLTKTVKKAGTQAPSSLECNEPRNMYYSDKDTAKFLEGSSIMDAYNANKFIDDWN
jgi:hypothetical protein